VCENREKQKLRYNHLKINVAAKKNGMFRAWHFIFHKWLVCIFSFEKTSLLCNQD